MQACAWSPKVSQTRLQNLQASYVVRMQRKMETHTDHDAEQRVVNMGAKRSTWPNLQRRSYAMFLKKLEMGAKRFRSHVQELSSRALVEGKAAVERNMVSRMQRVLEVGDDDSQAGTVGGRQQGTEKGPGQGRSSVGSPAVAKDAAKPKTPRLGGQGGLDTSSWGKGPGAAGFQTMKHCSVAALQGLLVKGAGIPAGVKLFLLQALHGIKPSRVTSKSTDVNIAHKQNQKQTKQPTPQYRATPIPPARIGVPRKGDHRQWAIQCQRGGKPAL